MFIYIFYKSSWDKLGKSLRMATQEGLDYDPADGHYSDVVLTIRILMGKVCWYIIYYSNILVLVDIYLYYLLFYTY